MLEVNLYTSGITDLGYRNLCGTFSHRGKNRLFYAIVEDDTDGCC